MEEAHVQTLTSHEVPDEARRRIAAKSEKPDSVTES